MLRARKTRFRWDDVPRDWLPADPATQRVIDVLHLLLPAGERWFCRVLSQIAPRIDDPSLRAELDGFIRQEAWHANAHADVLAYFARNDIDTEAYTRGIDWLFDEIGGDRPFGLPLPRRGWLELRVAVIAAIEHYTCVLGTWMLAARGLDDAGADPTMLDLLRWHAAEEIEHRAVAFDVTRALGVGWFRRYLAYVAVLPILTHLWTRGVRFLATRKPFRGQDKPSWQEFFRAGSQDRLPTVGYLLKATLRLASPFYDPRREGSVQDAKAYLRRSPAVRELG